VAEGNCAGPAAWNCVVAPRIGRRILQRGDARLRSAAAAMCDKPQCRPNAKAICLRLRATLIHL